MKKNLITGISAGLLTLSLLPGCASVETETAPVVVSEPLCKNIVFVKETKNPLQVVVTSSGESEAKALAETLKRYLNHVDVKCVSGDKSTHFDVKVYLDSKYRVLTAPPQCRLSFLCSITVADANNTIILPEWKHKTDSHQVCKTEAEAKENMQARIDSNIKTWATKNFREDVNNHLQSATIQFMIKDISKQNKDLFNSELYSFLNALRQIKGVIKIDVIKADMNSNVISFRVLYRKNVNLAQEIQKQK